LKEAVEDTARASLAAAVPLGANFSLSANSRQDNLQRVADLQIRYFSSLSRALYVFSLLLALTLIILSVWALRRRRILSGGLAVTFGLLLALVILFFTWPVKNVFGSGLPVLSPLERLSAMLQGLYGAQDELLALALVGGLVGCLALIAHTIRKKDNLLAGMLVLAPLFFGGLLFLVFTSSRGNLYPEGGVLALLLLAILLVPLAFLLRSAGFALERQPLPALASLAVVVFFAAGLLPALAYSGAGFSGASAGALMRDGALPEEVMMEAVEAPMLAPQPTAGAGLAEDKAAGMEAPAAAQENGAADQAGQGEPPRLRQYFPETMLWMAEAVTDPSGHLRLEVPIADSITTWRVTALASTQDGRLGSASTGLRVFQDFFIDLDLPPAASSTTCPKARRCAWSWSRLPGSSCWTSR
jgi:hypothetical protein